MATSSSRSQWAFTSNTPRIIGQWTPSDLVGTGSELSVTKTNFQLLSSYNWVPQKVGDPGSIIVPGFPPQWNPPILPKTLPADNGLVIINQNAYRNPKCPLEPLIQALLITQPTYNLNRTHIICDRNNLRNLFDFVCGKTKDDFDIALEMVNNTALFTRLEAATTEFINPSIQFRGFGHEFEKAFTKIPQVVEGSTGHHRIVGYTFGGLNMVVRFEADAAVPVPGSTGSLPRHLVSPTTRGSSAGATTDDLVGRLSQLGLSQGNSNPRTTTTTNSKRVTIRKAGELIAQEHIIEIKTRVEHKPIGVQDCMPQLWFSDTRKLYVGLHRRGTFDKVNKHDVNGTTIATWERTYKKELGKLVVLLYKILHGARGNTERMRIRCRNGRLRLEDWYASSSSEHELELLPVELKGKWSLMA